MNPVSGSPYSKKQLLEGVDAIRNQYKSYLTNGDKSSESLRYYFKDQKQQKLLLEISRLARITPENLTEDDIINFYPIEDKRLSSNHFFILNLSQWFKTYHIKMIDHQFEIFRKEKLNAKDANPYTDKDFEERYGSPPWELVNEILSNANLPYRITNPLGQNPEVEFEVQLRNQNNKELIKFHELSSGEKMYMTLALSMYSSEVNRGFPKLVLMDEPDASLHPSLIRDFISVINEVLIKKHRVKVILSTHSPSTVAIVPESSLYVMSKENPAPTKTTKDRALKVLTEGVPSLSFHYENRRQVFTESKYDVIFYEGFYKKLSNYLIPEISLNFISSGVKGKGNSHEVKTIVNKLSSYGNRSIFGVIDRDKLDDGNEETEFIKILGVKNRYSAENYILDPVLLAAFLIREKFIKKEDLGLEEEDIYSDFKDFEPEKIQQTVDTILAKLKPNCGENLDDCIVETELVDGRKFTLPKWFTEMHGHTLEEKIKITFAKLRRFQGEATLKLEIVDKIIDELPCLINKDFVDLFLSIQRTEIDN